MAEKLTDAQIVTAVNQEFEHALGSPGGEISSERATAWDYYLQKEFGNEDDEVSEVVTSDVADVVDSIMPSLLKMFTTQDNLLTFDPYGPEDEEAAQQETDYVSHVFFKKNPSFEILYCGFFDALVQKTGIFKAWWDESEEVTTERYEGLSEEEFYDLVSDDELEIVERSERKETMEVSVPSPVDGQMMMVPMEVTLHDVEFRRVTKDGRAQVMNLPPEEYRVSSDCRSMDPSTARMVGHEREVTRDELLGMGFDKKIVDDLSADGGATVYTEKYAREDKSDDRDKTGKSVDKSQDVLVLREAYIKIDADGDGRSELLQVFTVGSTLLSKEPADRQPFHVICPYPLPHKHIGRSAADKVGDIQEVNSVLLRQTLGNLYHSNQPGHGVWEQGLGETTMDDLLTTKVGRVATFARPVNESYSPMVVPFTAGASFPMIEYFDKAKRDRTGISSDSEGLSPEALKNIQTTVLAQSVDLSKMKVETVARIFAETGLKTLFLHLHELVLKHQQKAEIVKLRNTWVKVNPAEWRERKDMTVQIGLGIGTRENNLIHLNAIKDLQAQIAQGGGMNLVVTPKNIFNTAVEVVKNANYKRPEMFFTDPGNKPAPPPSDEQQELQKMQAEIKQREQQLDAERQAVKGKELELKAQEQQLNHAREVEKIKEKAQEREDKYSAANEKLRTEMLELRNKLEQQEREFPLKEASTAADIATKRASVKKTEAEIAAMEKEEPVPGADPLDDIAAAAEIERTRAQVEKERAATEKLEAETEGQRIENQAAVEGINEILEETNGESEETE
jgi:hypothetical protein